jgi:hypothetical protein
MPLNDWMAKYPQVQALLQQEGEVLAYAVDGEAEAPRPPALPPLVDVEPEVLTPQAISGEVVEVLEHNPTATLSRVVEFIAHTYALEVDELLAFCPHLAEAYSAARAERLEALHLRLVGAEACLAARGEGAPEGGTYVTQLQETIQAMEAMALPTD